MLANDEISEDLYLKCLVALSWEYLREDELRETLSILQGVKPQYFRDVMLQQMADDPKFEEIVVCIAAKLVDEDVIDMFPPLRPTQLPGLA